MLQPNHRLGVIAICLLLVASNAFCATSQTLSERQYLSGKDKDDTVDWEFFCTSGKKSGNWTTIPVPSCWDVKGFGTLNYYKDGDTVEQGKYRHNFQVPADWSGRHVELVFDGVFTDTEARLNGKPVGPAHQGGFYQFRYDVTKLLQPGKDNQIEVDVKKKSDNDSINRAERIVDFWIYGGIFRPVYLEAMPAQYIERVAIDAKADGKFAADVFTPEAQPSDSVEVALLDHDGKTVGSGKTKPGQRVECKADGVNVWTSETPNLYTARFRLTRGGNVLHEITKRFGFRTIEVRAGDGIYLNGSKIILKGVCRHAAWPDSGRTLNAKIDADDIALIQSMNMNSVRMSHYPPDESFLDLCDEKGLMVLDEETSWQKKYDSPTAIRLAGETVRRDVNHPCILFWDNGNEGGWNTDADPEFAKWDPQHRAVLHPWELHGGVNTKHYPTYSLLQQLLNGPDIVMPTEFLHGLYDGGMGAGFADYWKLMTASPKSAGGFFWVFSDEGTRRPDSGKIDVAGNAAPDGILGPYREKEGSYYTIRSLWSPVIVPETLPDDFDGKLSVKNGYNFSSLKRVKLEWLLLKYKGMTDAEAGHDVIAHGDIESMDLAAGKSGTLALPLPADWKNADAVALRATDWTGLDVLDRVYPLDAKHTYGPKDSTAKDAPKGRGNRTLKSGGVTMQINGEGSIESISANGQALAFKAGPRLALGKPTPREQRRRGQEPPAPAAATPSGQGKLTQAEWTAGSDGWFRLSYTIEANGPCDYLGVTFDLPTESVKSARWLGVGPYRVYQNRLGGGNVDVWDLAYNDSITGWSGFNVPEFKGYRGDVRWATLTTTAGKISIVPETRGLYLHLLTPDLPPGNLSAHATAGYPDGQISLMHAISAIGSKFTVPQESGPQGQPFEAKGSYNGQVWFRFE